jgi:hypothetical protein
MDMGMFGSVTSSKDFSLGLKGVEFNGFRGFDLGRSAGQICCLIPGAGYGLGFMKVAWLILRMARSDLRITRLTDWVMARSLFGLDPVANYGLPPKAD